MTRPERTRLEQLNENWLAAWTAQDADRLVSFYTQDCRYFDAQLPDGLSGRDALRERFSKLFALAPAMHYEPDRIWPLEGGFCSRWLCTIRSGGIEQQLRGLGLVLLDADQICHNEIYSHAIQADFRS